MKAKNFAPIFMQARDFWLTIQKKVFHLILALVENII
jgi:hypothetical protein